MLQLTELIPMDTPLGFGHAIIFQPGEHDNYWTVVIASSCAIVDFPQSEVRACRNYTRGWKLSTAEMKDIIK